MSDARASGLLDALNEAMYYGGRDYLRTLDNEDLAKMLAEESGNEWVRQVLEDEDEHRGEDRLLESRPERRKSDRRMSGDLIGSPERRTGFERRGMHQLIGEALLDDLDDLDAGRSL